MSAAAAERVPAPGAVRVGRTSEELREFYESRVTRVTPADEVVGHHVRMRDDMRDFRTMHRLENYMNYVAMTKRKQGSIAVQRALSRIFHPAANAGELARIYSGELFRARTYQVTSEMVDAVSQTYEKSAGLIGYLVEEELPFEAGFVWLDKPFLMQDRHGRIMAIRVVTWSTQSVLVRGGSGSDPFPVTGIRLSAWHHIDDPDAYWNDTDLDTEFPRGPSGFVLCVTQLLTVGERYGGRVSEDGLEAPEDFAHWMHVLWCFMQMEIVHHAQAPLSRPAMRRARLLKRPPKSVNVITLRRFTPPGEDERDPESRHIDWSCQWVVQGFHRHMRRKNHKAIPGLPDRGLCAVCGEKISWVNPFIKGPAGMPLRSPEQLYRLER